MNSIDLFRITDGLDDATLEGRMATAPEAPAQLQEPPAVSPATFRHHEHGGWEARAQTYRHSLGRVTAQAIAPLLDTFGNLRGRDLLDVACGSGELAAEACRRGARVAAVDFSARMLAVAAQAAPRVSFACADAAALPYADARFDAVSCTFGLLHFTDADRAVSEARRVLRRGGRYSFCTWCPPDGRGGFFELVLGAIQRHGQQRLVLPEAPPFFRFAAAAQNDALLRARGFAAPSRRIIELLCRVDSPLDLLLLIQRGTVRMSMVLEAQTAAARAAIKREIAEGAAALADAQGIALRMPVVITSAQAV